jgi:hypothetical protein
MKHNDTMHDNIDLQSSIMILMAEVDLDLDFSDL